MAEEKDIKNILELLGGIKEVAVFGKKVLKDGKVNVADLALLAELLKKLDVLSEAVKDVKEVVPEAKDLSEAEVVLIITTVLAAVKEFKEA